jgi:hypothetical protein
MSIVEDPEPLAARALGNLDYFTSTLALRQVPQETKFCDCRRHRTPVFSFF